MKKTELNKEKVITILLADDHKLLRDTWCLLLDKDPRFRIVGQAPDGKLAVDLATQINPDIILMDINMAPVNGLQAAEAILKANPHSKIIAVSMNMNLAIVKKILQVGLWGYVSKNSPLAELSTAIVNVHNGEKYICDEIKNLLAQTFVQEEADGPEALTYREITVLQLVKQGLSSREIAENLGISSKTVEVHRYNILKKTRVRNTAALMSYCVSNGL